LTSNARVSSTASLSTGISADRSNASRKLTLWPLIAATFFMVSGGTYGTEDIIGGAGYAHGILILLLTPVLWSLPTAMMIGELATAMPHEGGYYAWVRRALGDFWGFQEAWLSLTASIFDMAIYPTLAVAYLTRLFPWVSHGRRGILVALGIVTVCALLNVAGIHVVGKTSFWLFIVLSAPFAVMAALAMFRIGALDHTSVAPAGREIGMMSGILICMWNYMGWDNASTVAGEVHNPQRNYPLALLGALALIATCYIIPVAALWQTGIDPSGFTTGSWVAAANQVVGPWLGWTIVFGGMICGLGMNNALVLSYSRVPYAMAEDRMLPSVLARTNSKGVPWISVIVCAIAWTACLPLGFDRLIAIDILVYSLSLLLEFIALIALRIKEPALERPFRIGGGMPVLVLLTICPMVVLAVALAQNYGDRAGPLSTLTWGALVILLGVLVYPLTRRKRANVRTITPENG